MSTTYEALAPELRLALRAACEVDDPVERGRQRAQLALARMTRRLCVVAGCVLAYDLVLLTGG